MELKEEDKIKLLKLSEISLTLERYEDIFSSFDSRPYHERALSVDFIDEAKRASIDKNNHGIELNLLMPKKKRDEYDELIIKERLKSHFRKHLHQLTEEKKQRVDLGFRMVLLGVAFMFTATYLLFKFGNENLMMSFFIVLLEPAGWFTFWEGLNHAIFHPKENEIEIEFYKKMSNAEIHFKSY